LLQHETDWHLRVSQPDYEMMVEEDVLIPMRDGVQLRADVYRPRAPGRFPGLLSLSIYGKLSQKLPTHPKFQPSDYITGTGGHECGEQNYYVPRGYVQVIPDVRGVAGSDGEFSMDCGKDGYDVIEWMARQDWCNGNVGMLGMSQFGMAQYQVAALQPPSLKAISPFEARSDAYRHHFYHGGILNYLFANSYARLLPIRSRRLPLSLREFSATELAQIQRRLLSDPDVLCVPYLSMTAETPQMNPLIFDLLAHPFDGDFYRRQSARPVFGEIRVPALLGSRWNGGVLHLQGAFEAYAELATPAEQKKLLIVPSDNYGGMDRPFHEIQDVILRFYDHWLKGNDTGMMAEPPVLLFVQGINTWRYETEFPSPQTQWTRFHLRSDGQLTHEAPEGDEQPRTFANDPWLNPSHGSSRADVLAAPQAVPCLTYRTPVLSESVEVTGPIALYWHAAIDSSAVEANVPTQPGISRLEPLTNDTNWYLKLYDIDVDDARRCVAEGWLKASHHEIDPDRSKPFAPYHPHSRALPIAADEIIRYAADLRMTSNVFLAGHRIELQIAAQDRVQALWYHQPHMARVTHTIYSDRSRPSHLLLPVMPRGYGGAGIPKFLPEGPFRYPKFQRA
jgi:uncharacterized protein